jgi:uncharacterized protein
MHNQASHHFDPSQPRSIETLQIVFKVAERCNINCTYCYYFNMGENTALERPPLIDVETARAFARWIGRGCEELQIPKAMVAFHGGEPMLLKPRNFGAICEALRDEVGSVTELSLSIQTNGTILSDTWLDLFREHGVRIGVSIDGNRQANDRYRLSRRGKSTFSQTEDFIKRTVAWAEGNPRLIPATISVIDPRNDYKEVYAYLRSLGVEQMNFLLPDRNAEQALSLQSSRGYGRALYEIFESWLTEDNPAVRVKYVNNLLGHFQLSRPDIDLAADIDAGIIKAPQRLKKQYQVIIARSDGTVAINDSYIPALSWYKDAPVYSISSHTLRDFLSDAIFQEIEAMANTLPSGCKSCQWRKICGGGDLENRFSTKTGFDNPSVYCEGYKWFYQQFCDLLVSNGYPLEAVHTKVSA